MYICVLNRSTYLKFRNLLTLIFPMYGTFSCRCKQLLYAHVTYATQITTCEFIKIIPSLSACKVSFKTLRVILFLKIQLVLLVCCRKQEITHCYQEYVIVSALCCVFLLIQEGQLFRIRIFDLRLFSSKFVVKIASLRDCYGGNQLNIYQRSFRLLLGLYEKPYS
jgi:hypothetical protein